MDRVRSRPAIEVIFGHTLFGKAFVFGRLSEHIRYHQDLEANALVIAKVIALIELMPAAKLRTHRVPKQLHELDTVEGAVTIRTAHELIEVLADLRHLEINRVRRQVNERARKYIFDDFLQTGIGHA